MSGQSQPSDRERAAYEIVRRILGVEVEHRDDGLRQGEVDAHIIQADGLPSALEVTVVGEQATLEVEQVLIAGDAPEIPGLQWRWDVRPGPRTRNKGFHDRLAPLLRACERDGVTRPDRLTPRSQAETAALASYLDSDCTIVGNPETNFPGTVEVLPPTMGGAVDDGLLGLGEWLGTTLTRGHLARHVDKLARTGFDRQHLFLIVHATGMPFSLYYALAFDTATPPGPPTLPFGLTDLWLSTGWSAGGVLRFNKESGWTRHAPFNRAEPEDSI